MLLAMEHSHQKAESSVPSQVLSLMYPVILAVVPKTGTSMGENHLLFLVPVAPESVEASTVVILSEDPVACVHQDRKEAVQPALARAVPVLVAVEASASPHLPKVPSCEPPLLL